MTESTASLFEKLVQAGPPGDVPVLFDTACVIGGSIAGLLAARVLCDRARRVVVIEPDDIPAEARSRPGVPQGQQVHTLLPAGQRWVERWIPGITKEAQDRGAPFVPDKGTTIVNGVPQAPDGEGHHLLPIGRPLLETLIRNRVTSIPRYIGLADLAVHDELAPAELLALFAPDATVQMGPEPVHGHAAVAVEESGDGGSRYRSGPGSRHGRVRP
jgi:hypothetical protein